MATQKVDHLIQCDTNLKSTAALLGASHARPTISGLEDLDYPNTIDPSCRIPLTSGVTTVPLPTQLVEQFINMRTNCEMGLFTEIARAWLSIDSVVYIWSYDNANDVAYYNDLEQTILGVCLIRPKPGIFKPHIKYLLCLTTALEVVGLGVTFGDEESNKPSVVLLIPDPVFKLATDDVVLTTIAGTQNGRIFLGGKDGCLYEITYQAEPGWFSKKSRKINHSANIFSYVIPSFLNFIELEPIAQIEIDDSRHILYTRSDKGTIQVYDLGHDGQQMSHVTSKPLSAIVNRASSIATTIDSNNLKPIVNIKVISKSESNELNLIAITHTGVRLYFNAGRDRPNTLDLVHIRLPPGFTPSSALQKPNSVNNVYYKNNTLIMTSMSSQDKDFLWFLSNDAFFHHDKMMESFSVTPLNGRVWRIAEEICSCPGMTRFASAYPPPVLTQHLEDRKKFVLLTSQGVHIIYKLRPIDQLSRILLDGQGHEAPAVRQFFESSTPTEACLTSLILACTAKLPQEAQLSEWATLAFFRYGGEPRIIRPSHRPITTTSTPISSPNQSFPSNISPIVSYVSNSHYDPDTQQVVFSARHDAVYLYLARTLRPIWSVRVAKSQPPASGQTRDSLVNNAKIDEISCYLTRLMELKQFLNNNVQLTADDPKVKLKMNGSRLEPLDAIIQERESLTTMINLLNRCIEVLNLYRLLCEHKFSVVCANLNPESQNQLLGMSFKDLIVNGNEMTTMIAGALVRRYLDDNISTDAISHRLHDLCPSIYRQENALHAKAHEILLKSRLINDPIVVERNIAEAVTLFKNIGGRINLQSACDLLYSVKAYKSIVDLCLYIAERRDPQNLASYYRKTAIFQLGNQWPDCGDQSQAAQAARDRMDCYLRIIDTLDRLINSSRSFIPSPLNSMNQSMMEDRAQSTDEAKLAFDQVISAAVRSSDDMFHVKLYEWLCDSNLSSKLLDIQSPHLEDFLKHKANSVTDSTKHLDLLWMYYERHGAFSSAAQILNRLASKRTDEYDLHKRMEYLSRASICMQSCTSSVIITENNQRTTPGEFLHELEEKMEVARIQLTIFKRIKEMPDSGAHQEAISRLNCELLELTPLYEDFAEKFRLYDCQLAILKSAGHHDPSLIETLWQNIIDELVSKFAHETPGSQITLMSHELKNLVVTFMPSERYFPAGFVVGYLEFRTHHLNNTRWIFQTLLEIGFSLVSILNTYHKFYKSRDQSTSWPRKAIHVLTVISCMMEAFITKTHLSPNERSSVASVYLDVLCGYIIDLQTMGSSDRQVKQLLDSFRNIQARIGHRV